MDNQGKEISVGNAAKIASELTQLSLVHQIPPETVEALYFHYLETIAPKLIEVSEAQAPAFDPAAALQSAFPGSTFVPQQPAAPAAPAAPQYVAPPSQAGPFPGAPSAPAPSFVPAAAVPAAAPAVPQGPGPAPIPGASTGGPNNDQKAAEALEAWTVFFTDIQNGSWAQNWEDVRANKRSDKSPDFKHKSWKRPGSKFFVGLWVGAKENPDWVAPQLAQLGIA
jgi:hypothetical protein